MSICNEAELWDENTAKADLDDERLRGSLERRVVQLADADQRIALFVFVVCLLNPWRCVSSIKNVPQCPCAQSRRRAIRPM